MILKDYFIFYASKYNHDNIVNNIPNLKKLMIGLE